MALGTGQSTTISQIPSITADGYNPNHDNSDQSAQWPCEREGGAAVPEETDTDDAADGDKLP